MTHTIYFLFISMFLFERPELFLSRSRANARRESLTQRIYTLNREDRWVGGEMEAQ